MKKDNLVSLIVVVTAAAFFDPFMYLMPSALVSVILGLLMVSSVFYALMIYKEKAQDERDVSIRAFADRMAGLVGTGLLVLIIVYQILTLHHVDPIIIWVLIVMVIVKQLAHLFAEKYR